MDLLDTRPGSLAHKAKEAAKFIAFRSKWLNFLSRPRYPFAIKPGQLAWLAGKIEETRQENDRPGAIVEVGVARGMTSVFLLEHMRCNKDPRPYYCIDTFNGFIEKDVAFEENTRRKDRVQLVKYRYNSQHVFESNLKKAGYSNAVTIGGDAAKVDFAKIGPIDVMLLDVDLYLPTKAVLHNVLGHLNTHAFIMVDDCMPNQRYDGADEAYNEFVRSHDRRRLIVGGKGGVLEHSLESPLALVHSAASDAPQRQEHAHN